MGNNEQSQSKRIFAIDALRGFAVMAIMLLHNIEHFNFYSFPKPTSDFIIQLDTSIWDMLFFSFSGKVYAIFALLFGFTFYLQYTNAAKRGVDFKNRYMWRLLLLLGFGFINSLFFPGEILVLYALLGFVLIPVRKVSNKALFIIATILMLQPVEWMKVAVAAFQPAYNPQQMIFSLGDVYPQLGGDSLWEMVKANFVTGQLASLNWAWCYGRVFQTSSLFMLGLLLGRIGVFSTSDAAKAKRSTAFWQNTLCLSLPIALVLYFFKGFLFTQIETPLMLASLKTIFNSWYNLFFMLSIVSCFLLLYWNYNGKFLKVLVPYGKMSLTDYVTQSVIGSFIYFGYGLGMHQVIGTTYSVLVGILLLIAQVIFAHIWFRYFKRGPLETIWHKLTWLKTNK